MEPPGGNAEALQRDCDSSAETSAAARVFHEFLGSLEARDVPRAMQCVAADFHAFEDDREITANDFRCRLEAFIESVRGWEAAISVPAAPEIAPRSLGTVIFAEIQIDLRNPATGKKDNLVARRSVLLQKQADSLWKISAMGRVSI
jgi:ketosteroid isomerase-like protein